MPAIGMPSGSKPTPLVLPQTSLELTILGNKEVGEILRLRAGHVAVILYRALRKLRTRLEREMDG